MTFDRIQLAHLPTPVHELKNILSGKKAPRLLIKRDDCTGLALGGNKTRKLEYLIAEAINKKADVLVTAGAAQSNHCRQTAAAAAMQNLKCVLLLGGEGQDPPSGNVLLDHLFGASIVWTGSERQGESLEKVAEKLRDDGYSPYIIPYGASNPLGALGYVEAVKELMKQLSEKQTSVDHIILPTSSCGTQAGLIVGSEVYGFKGTIIGISVDKEGAETGQLSFTIENLCNRTAELIGLSRRFTGKDVIVDCRYTGCGYGVPDEREIGAIRRTASREGILLDPVYTARAMGALLDMIDKERFSTDETILFWHTGGTPSLFACDHLFHGLVDATNPTGIV